MYFMVFGNDKLGMHDVRIATRPAHREYLRNSAQHKVTVHIGGPTLKEDGVAMNGTLLLVEAADIDAVRAMVADDPYSRAGLFQSVEIRPFNWSLNPPVAN